MEVVLIAHNIRSTYNIGSLARTADGLGVNTIYCTGYTPYIVAENDERPPHVRQRVIRELHKTALGAENSVQIKHQPDIVALIHELRSQDYQIVGLEQTRNSGLLRGVAGKRTAVILGEEVHGLPADIQKLCDQLVEIPMLGSKESFNVSVAGALAMYELKRDSLYTKR